MALPHADLLRRSPILTPVFGSTAHAVRVQREREQKAEEERKKDQESRRMGGRFALISLLYAGTGRTGLVDLFNAVFNGSGTTTYYSAPHGPLPAAPSLGRAGALGGVFGAGASALLPSSDLAQSGTFPENVRFVRAYQADLYNTVYVGANGEMAVKHRTDTRDASLSWMNNNPGNLRFTAFSRAQGAIGQDEKGFAIFPNVGTGMQAQAQLLRSRNYAGLTLERALYRYAPPSENDTESYVRQVERATGISRHMALRDIPAPQMDRLVLAMARHEGWNPGHVRSNGAPAIQIADAAADAGIYAGTGGGIRQAFAGLTGAPVPSARPADILAGIVSPVPKLAALTL